MNRRFALILMALLPLLCAADKKRSYIGVMIAAGKEKGTFVILSAIAKSPADRAGLKGGDVLLKIDGAIPPDLATAVKVIGALKPGKQATFLIRREGKEKEIVVVPEER